MEFNFIKVSIIIPVYNAQDTIKKAVDSTLNQKFPKKDFEVIVINDGSTDKTPEILKKYGKKIKVINQKNRGYLRAANRGFKVAKGKYMIKLDADDYFKPTTLKEMVVVLDKYPEIDFVYCDYYEKSPVEEIKLILTKNIFNTISGGVMFRKNNLVKEGFYNEKIRFAEYDLLLKTQNKWKGYHITKPLFYYNRREKSITKNKKWVKEAINQLKKLYPEKLKEIRKIRQY